MSEYTEQFDGPPHPYALDPAAERVSGSLERMVSRLEQELSDTKALLRFQEMHKSAEMLKDKARIDWLLKESHIRFETMDGCLYATCRQTIDDQMRAAEPANAENAERVNNQ